MEASQDRKARKQKTYGKSTAKRIFSTAFHKLSPDNGFSKKLLADPTKIPLPASRLPLTSLSTNFSGPSSPPLASRSVYSKSSGLSRDPILRDMNSAGYNESPRQLAVQGPRNDAGIDRIDDSLSRFFMGRLKKDDCTTSMANMDHRRTDSAGIGKSNQPVEQSKKFNDNSPRSSAGLAQRRVDALGNGNLCRQLTAQRFKSGITISELSGDFMKLSTNTADRDHNVNVNVAYSSQHQSTATGFSQQEGNLAHPELAKGSGCLVKGTGKAEGKPASKKISVRDIEHNFYKSQLAKLCSLSVNPDGPLEFQAWASEAARKLTVTKIAEASYGEVYRLRPKHGTGAEAKDCHSVVKVVAIQPFRMPKNSKLKKSQMSPVNEIISEVEIMDRMADIPGFVVFKGLHVIQGKLAKQYVDAWTVFHNADPSRSLFPNPNNKSTYPSDQLWAVIEMEDAGDELSDVPVSNFIQAWDIFWGVTLALAKGEEMARFEHRDLHIGNVCVTKTRPSIKENSALISTLSSEKFGLSGLTTTIIDYTLSRTDANESNISSGEGQTRVIFTDLDRDRALFEAEGDYQYDIYRITAFRPAATFIG
ncbi:hypothetical protein GP486_006714 [Trichoglossum hirsutum]|uniref:Protein kinase domain-containing protein n=1 Tax=Trichoglossum hirsutum TaxID=265104 RepID=A0A9P8IIC6_9PEZI|nr:hypothetical protein GP486_006714 [Trichoglossum hirsutum]